MSEIVNINDREFPGFFVIAAITQAKEQRDKIKPGPLEVMLTVNGVELPFTATINDIYARMQAQLEEDAQELAQKMVTEAGLDGLAEALRDAEHSIKSAIQAVAEKQ